VDLSLKWVVLRSASCNDRLKKQKKTKSVLQSAVPRGACLLDSLWDQHDEYAWRCAWHCSQIQTRGVVWMGCGRGRSWKAYIPLCLGWPCLPLSLYIALDSLYDICAEAKNSTRSQSESSTRTRSSTGSSTAVVPPRNWFPFAVRWSTGQELWAQLAERGATHWPPSSVFEH